MLWLHPKKDFKNCCRHYIFVDCCGRVFHSVHPRRYIQVFKVCFWLKTYFLHPFIPKIILPRSAVCTVAQNFGHDLLHFSMYVVTCGGIHVCFSGRCAITKLGHNLFTLSLTIYFWILSYLPCSLFVLSPNNHTLPNK